jgi:hypothetical protein
MPLSLRVPLLLAALLAALAAGGRAAALDNANVADAEHAPLLRESEPFIATVAVRNPYDRAAKVKLLDPSCSCATLEISSTFILPHQTADLHIAVLNHDRSGPQHIGVTVFLTDPEFEAIEVNTYWTVRAAVQVDALPPSADPLARPADKAWQDVYQYVAKARPDELNRLRKRIRLSCPPEELPAGGLKVLAIDYAGSLWRFAPTAQADGSILILATARDPAATAPEGELSEKVVVHTNHADKPAITLTFLSDITKDAGTTSRDPAR